MKIISWTLIALGVVIQVFYSFSAFFLPSMASVEGVATYPPAAEIILQFSFRVLPYAIFGGALIIADRRFPKLRFAIYIGVIAAVICPLVIAAVASLTPVPVAQFREVFWPIRPIVQIAVFVAAISAVWLVWRTTELSI